MDRFIPLLVLAAVAVLLFVLPARQRKAMAARTQAMQEQLTVGTPVMLTSGLHGTVAGLAEGTVDVEIAPGVVTTWARPAVMEVRRPPGDGGAGTDVTTAPAVGGATGYVDGDGDPTARAR